jgi:hypothetical protein
MQILRDNPNGVCRLFGKSIEPSNANIMAICSSMESWNDEQFEGFMSLHPAYEFFEKKKEKPKKRERMEETDNLLLDRYYTISKSKIHFSDLILGVIIICTILIITSNGKNK